MEKKQKIHVIILIIVLILIFYVKSAICTDIRNSAVYSPDYNNIFWYIHISDVHIGTEDPNYFAKYEPNFKWILTTAKNAIKPSFIANTGDFVDASDPKDEYVSPLFLLLKYPPNGQQYDEWLKYEKYLKETNILFDEYYDVPGNHERYNDKNWNGIYDNPSKRFLGYSSTSIHGPNTNPIGQFCWQKTLANGDTYIFIAANTCDESGRAWSEYVNTYGLFGAVSDEPELSEEESRYIERELMKFYPRTNPIPQNKLAFIFGHAGIYRLIPKQINPFGEWNLNEIGDKRGAPQFVGLLNLYNVSAYSFGHTHKDRDLYDLNSFHDISTRLINTSSLTEQDMYRIVAVDNNGVSSRTFKVTKWPIVLITSPLEFTSKGFDISLNECTINNPYACTLKPTKDNFVRALAFSPQGLYKVEFRYKKNSLLSFFWSDWEEMKSVASNTYQAGWDCSSLDNGEYKLDVRVQGSGDSEDSHTIIVKINNNQCVFASPNNGEILKEWLWLVATIDDELLNQTPTSGIKSALFYYSSDKINWEPIYPAITSFNSKEIICDFKPEIKSGKLWFKIEIEVKNGLFSTYKTSDESENPVTIDNVPPTVPANLSAKAIKNGGIELRWTSSIDDNLAGYRIYRKASDESDFTLQYDGVTGNSFIDRATENGKTYYYKMKAYDSSKGHSGKYPQ